MCIMRKDIELMSLVPRVLFYVHMPIHLLNIMSVSCGAVWLSRLHREAKYPSLKPETGGS